MVNRPGVHGQPPDGFRWEAVEVPEIGLSSSHLRERISAGRSVRFMTPGPVIDLVEEWQLYRHRE